MTAMEFLRKESGLTLNELGRIIGVHPTAIVQVERESRKPWPKLRKQIAEVFEVDEGVLFNAEGWPKKIKVNLRGE